MGSNRRSGRGRVRLVWLVAAGLVTLSACRPPDFTGEIGVVDLTFPLYPLRPADGTVLVDNRTDGTNAVVLGNDSDTDAVAVLRTPAGAEIVKVYLHREGGRASFDRIADGTYEVAFATGVGWRLERKTFQQVFRGIITADPEVLDGSLEWTVVLPSGDGNAHGEEEDPCRIVSCS
jgi:hypothetical protein